MVFHWILNPVVAINELILGQRIPKVMLEDKTLNKPKFQRTFVPCPHCKTLHDQKTWATQNGTAFKNWFGLYCKSCGNIIPCVTNAFSFLILAITFPVWGWFKKDLKSIWLKKQPKRYENSNINQESNAFNENHWIKAGLLWGAFMFLLNDIVHPYFNEEKITGATLFFGAILWAIGGLAFGHSMNAFMNKK